MIRGLSCYFGLVDYFAVHESISKPTRQAHIIKSKVRVPNRKRVTFVCGMEVAISVNISGVSHELNSLALNVTPTQPNEPTYPRRHPTHIEHLSNCKRIEISDQHVETFLITLNALE